MVTTHGEELLHLQMLHQKHLNCNSTTQPTLLNITAPSKAFFPLSHSPLSCAERVVHVNPEYHTISSLERFFWLLLLSVWPYGVRVVVQWTSLRHVLPISLLAHTKWQKILLFHQFVYTLILIFMVRFFAFLRRNSSFRYSQQAAYPLFYTHKYYPGLQISRAILGKKNYFCTWSNYTGSFIPSPDLR